MVMQHDHIELGNNSNTLPGSNFSLVNNTVLLKSISTPRIPNISSHGQFVFRFFFYAFRSFYSGHMRVLFTEQKFELENNY